MTSPEDRRQTSTDGGGPSTKAAGTATSAVDEARAWLAERTSAAGPQSSGSSKSSWPLEPSASNDSSGLAGVHADSTPPPSPSPNPRNADADAEGTARSVILRRLSSQARTRHELSQALRKHHVPEEVGAAVLDRMEDVGLVDDEEFARGWVESRQARRYLSRTALRRELKAKGVAQDHIESALETVDGEDEYAVAMALAQRKARAMAGLEREVQYRRLGGVLGRRGFDAALTSRVLAQVLNTPSEPAEDRSARSPGA